jgi:hypothetical protein
MKECLCKSLGTAICRLTMLSTWYLVQKILPQFVGTDNYEKTCQKPDQYKKD